MDEGQLYARQAQGRLVTCSESWESFNGLRSFSLIGNTGPVAVDSGEGFFSLSTSCRLERGGK